MHILLTNDDGVFAPGLRALRKELRRLGDVTVVAPAQEQSGVGHSITLLTPLVVKQVDDDDGTTLGYMVEGSPADSVKLAILELMGRPTDLIVSGINAGANVGINVLYSGTVAAAIEGAFFKITSVAVSLELAEHFDYPHAAREAVRVIERILTQKPAHGETFERRKDPRGRDYYWLTYAPPFHLEGEPSDVSRLAEGYITVTPLHFDLTRRDEVERMSAWDWSPASR
ncbi:MAG: 5'-nucleotidase SurE [Isosphaeraceae bacterium]|jgi:5'-nucleotidase|nr:MAG: 5'-nucleotidase SurE [Isosphaeraceae bacterium]